MEELVFYVDMRFTRIVHNPVILQGCLRLVSPLSGDGAVVQQFIVVGDLYHSRTGLQCVPECDVHLRLPASNAMLTATIGLVLVFR